MTNRKFIENLANTWVDLCGVDKESLNFFADTYALSEEDHKAIVRILVDMFGEI